MHPILFDDIKNSGWCVRQVQLEFDGTVDLLLETGTVYASHATCTRGRIMTEDKKSERWSWFLDDEENADGIHICFECNEPVPKHIQALVVLHTPLGDMP